MELLIFYVIIGVNKVSDAWLKSNYFQVHHTKKIILLCKLDKSSDGKLIKYYFFNSKRGVKSQDQIDFV
jgi:hypothetical protein